MPEPLLSQAGMRVVRLLVGNEPQTISDLIKSVGVTRTAVTEQLNELVAAGFVTREVQRLTGRGRPRHVYSATDASMQMLFPGNQGLVVPAIFQAIRQIGGDKLSKDVFRRVSRNLAEHYKRSITAKKPRERLRQLIALLSGEGGVVEAVEDNGHLAMRKRVCLFISMFDEERSVCTVDLKMMSEIVGRRVIRTACRHDGDPCCVFKIAE